MISFEQAYEIVLGKARTLGSEEVGIAQALNRILAADVTSDVDMPPFDKSAMDGYACRRRDLGHELTIVESIPAGYVPEKRIGENQCAKIMTGAMVPPGADCVVMMEVTENPTATTMRFRGEKTADNICFKGEDVRAGEVVLRKGTRLGPEHIAMLASVGCVSPVVAQRPKVGIIATGDELVEPAEKPGDSQIRNSNSYQLSAQVAESGAIPQYYGIAADTERAIETMLKRAMRECDVILLSGGVSAGDFDLVPGILKKNDIELVFESVAIKPGKPTVFGVSGNVFCFGLPGNPVSTFILFEVLVKPFLYKMMGHDFKAATIRAPSGREIVRRRAHRMTWMPVAFTEEGKVVPVEYHGSAHIQALGSAAGIISIPAGVDRIEEGTFVHVRQI